MREQAYRATWCRAPLARLFGTNPPEHIRAWQHSLRSFFDLKSDWHYLEPSLRDDHGRTVEPDDSLRREPEEVMPCYVVVSERQMGRTSLLLRLAQLAMTASADKLARWKVSWIPAYFPVGEAQFLDRPDTSLTDLAVELLTQEMYEVLGSLPGGRLFPLPAWAAYLVLIDVQPRTRSRPDPKVIDKIRDMSLCPSRPAPPSVGRVVLTAAARRMASPNWPSTVRRLTLEGLRPESMQERLEYARWDPAELLSFTEALGEIWLDVRACPPILKAAVTSIGSGLAPTFSTGGPALRLLHSWAKESGLAWSDLRSMNSAAEKLWDVCCSSVPTGRPSFPAAPEINLRNFTPRKEVTDRILTWLRSDQGSRLAVLTGPHGAGKTFLTHWLSRHCEEVAGVFHCTWGTEDADPHVCLRQLVAQLADGVSEYREELFKYVPPAEIFSHSDSGRRMPSLESFLANYLIRRLPQERYGPYVLLIIDGLDEMRTEDKQRLMEALHRMQVHLPNWLRLLITCRRGDPVLAALGRDMQIELNEQEQKEAVAEYLSKRLPEVAPQMRIDEGEIRRVLNDPEKDISFRYAEYLVADIMNGNLKHLHDAPPSLSAYYHEQFRRLFPDPERFRREQAPLLEIFLAARPELQLPDVRRILLWDELSLHRILDSFGTLFQEKEERLVGSPELRDWLTNPSTARQWWVDTRRGDDILAKWFWQEVQEGRPSPYAKIRLPYHLARMERWDNLWQLYARNYDQLLGTWIEGASDDGRLCLKGMVDHFTGTGRAALLKTQLARIHLHRDEHESARRLAEEAIRALGRFGNPYARSIAFHHLASVGFHRGALEDAAANYRRAARWVRLLGLPGQAFARLWSFGRLAFSACAVGRIERWLSRNLYPPARQYAANLQCLGVIALQRGDYRRARRWLGRACRISYSTGDLAHAVAARVNLAALETFEGRFDRADLELRWCEERAPALKEGIERHWISTRRAWLLIAQDAPREQLEAMRRRLEVDVFPILFAYGIYVESLSVLRLLCVLSLLLGEIDHASNWLDKLGRMLQIETNSPGANFPNFLTQRAGHAICKGLEAHLRQHWDESIASFKTARDQFQVADAPREMSRAILGLAGALWWKGEKEGAEAEAEAAATVAGRLCAEQRRLVVAAFKTIKTEWQRLLYY